AWPWFRQPCAPSHALLQSLRQRPTSPEPIGVSGLFTMRVRARRSARSQAYLGAGSRTYIVIVFFVVKLATAGGGGGDGRGRRSIRLAVLVIWSKKSGQPTAAA